MSAFIWHELMTTDVDSASGFYAEVLGWGFEPFSAGGIDYRIVKAGERGVGGIMEIPEDARAAGARPFWIGYVAVADVDAAAGGIEPAGGRLHRDIGDVPGIGRIAMVWDPQGAPFYVMAPSGEEKPPSPDGAYGHVAWNELHTTDPGAALGFYSSRFGWEKDEAMDMGPMGTYQIFSAGGRQAGAMFGSSTFGRPGWMFYFQVGNIDEAAARVGAAGGEVLRGPVDVPGGGWIIQAADRQGALFALVGSRD
jgi:predicted enzyme related to lactoylglutathione lyase